MIHASSLQLTFGSRNLFDSISFDIKENARIGLIGANGSGKSTLLEAIIGLQELDGGTITISKSKKVAYLAQDVVLSSSLSILDEALSAFADFAQIAAELAALEQKLEHTQCEEDVERYAHLCQELGYIDPDQLRVETKKMLIGLGFKEQDFDKSVATLSVGWRMRIVLAKLLLQKADFYLFDEPTNHLDIFAKDWFLEFLRTAPFGFMLVCHERYFLDKLCTQIFELERGKGIFYQGNYSMYEVQKEHNRALLESAYQLQQKEIKHKQEIINKFKASASRAKQAQSMMKQLDKLERVELPPSLKSMNIHFPPIARSGKLVLSVENVGYSFGPKKVFEHINFEIERGQKVALVASNGGGKSTLLNIISGRLPLQEGAITLGSNVSKALFDQDQNAALEGKKTILQNIENNVPGNISTGSIRAFLGAFLFSGDDVNKKVDVLSGGEKNRVGMVKVLLQQANLLLLDEPTNHLDIDSKKVLLHALRAYEGTILFVSHDRAFLNDLASRVIELLPDGIISFEGNYDQYLYYKSQLNLDISTPAPIIEDTKKELKVKPNHEMHKKVKLLEKKIDELEQKIRTCELSFAQLTYGTDAYNKAQQDLQALQQKHQECMREWELLQQDKNL